MSQIQIAREADQTTYVQTEKKLGPSELDKLLAKKSKKAVKIDAELPTIKVRCDHSRKTWVILDDEGQEAATMDSAILMNVKFTWADGTSDLPGCGGIKEKLGFAVGLRLPANTPIKALNRLIKKLVFNRGSGHFYCLSKACRVEEASFVILKEDCSSEYIEKQKGAK